MASAPFAALQCYKTLATNVAVGMGAASFWRGAWYMLDDHLYPNDKAKSAAVSLLLGICGMRASQGLVARAERLEQKAATLAQKVKTGQHGGGERSLVWLGRIRISPAALTSWAVKLPRLGAVYSVAMSCVLVWRGTWVGWDVVYEHYHDNIAIQSTMHPHGSMMHRTVTKATDPGHAAQSGLLSHGIAVGLLLSTGLMASVLAPPAAVSVIRDVAIRSTPAAAATAAATTATAGATRSVNHHRQLQQQLSLVSNQWRMHSALSSSAVTTSAAAANHAFRKVHLLHHQAQPFASTSQRRQVYSTFNATSQFRHW
jgi:Fuseless